MARVVEMKKKTRGRQKIQMRLIEDREDRVITFSKRKAGIFKKASEISVMCGAKVLFILFSPVGKAYTFGHPSVKSVADNFLGREELGGRQIRQILETHLNNRLENLVLHHNMVKSDTEAITQHSSSLSDATKTENKGWWEANLAEMNSDQEVQQVLNSVVDFQLALTNHFENLRLQNIEQGSNSNPVAATNEQQLGVVNNFPQMRNWIGGNLSGGFGGFDNSFQGVNGAAGQSAVGNGGRTVGQGNAFSLPAAGYESTLGQGSGFGLPADGYDGTFGLADDGFGCSGAGYEEGASSGTNGTGPFGGGSSGGTFGGGDLGDVVNGSGFGSTSRAYH
ncbi:unnamed protein product [Rhodiola kirilowii]